MSYGLLASLLFCGALIALNGGYTFLLALSGDVDLRPRTKRAWIYHLCFALQALAVWKAGEYCKRGTRGRVIVAAYCIAGGFAGALPVLFIKRSGGSIASILVALVWISIASSFLLASAFERYADDTAESHR